MGGHLHDTLKNETPGLYPDVQERLKQNPIEILPPKVYLPGIGIPIPNCDPTNLYIPPENQTLNHNDQPLIFQNPPVGFTEPHHHPCGIYDRNFHSPTIFIQLDPDVQNTGGELEIAAKKETITRLSLKKRILTATANWAEYIMSTHNPDIINSSNMYWGQDLHEKMPKTIDRTLEFLARAEDSYPNIPITDLTRFLVLTMPIAITRFSHSDLDKNSIQHETLTKALINASLKIYTEEVKSIRDKLTSNTTPTKNEPTEAQSKSIYSNLFLQEFTGIPSNQDSVIQQISFGIELITALKDQEIYESFGISENNADEIIETIKETIRQVQGGEPQYLLIYTLIQLGEYTSRLSSSNDPSPCIELLEKSKLLKSLNTRINPQAEKIRDQSLTAALDKAISTMNDLAYAHLVPTLYKKVRDSELKDANCLSNNIFNQPVINHNTVILLRKIESGMSETNDIELHRLVHGLLQNRESGGETIDVLNHVLYDELTFEQYNNPSLLLAPNIFTVGSHKTTSKMLYRILNNPEIQKLLYQQNITDPFQNPTESLLKLESIITNENTEIEAIIDNHVVNRHDKDRCRMFFDTSESIDTAFANLNTLLGSQNTTVRLTQAYTRARRYSKDGSREVLDTIDLKDFISNKSSISEKLLYYPKNPDTLLSRGIHLHFEFDVANCDNPIRFEIQIYLKDDKKDIEYADAIYGEAEEVFDWEKPLLESLLLE